MLRLCFIVCVCRGRESQRIDNVAEATGLRKCGQWPPLQRVIDPGELLTLRKFGSRLEGHPTMEFPFTEVPTASSF